MRSTLIVLVYLHCTTFLFSQATRRAIVADSITHRTLPFATVRPGGGSATLIAGLNGTVEYPANSRLLYVSYINYNHLTISIDSLRDGDTIFLSPTVHTLGEVIVKPQADKVARIINTAIGNKSLNNPEMYDAYHCHVYYKMWTDLKKIPPTPSDSARKAKAPPKNKKGRTSNPPDSSKRILGDYSHAIFSETISRRSYRRPQQLQETIIASRFSGLKKTYFANLVSHVIPFHLYTDYITLNGKSYINPVSKGWQRNYSFYLADEIITEKDTTFIFSFAPKKGANFNSLTGLLYIHSDRYAISHFTGSAGDTSTGRGIRVEQIYHRIGEKWFPLELNYNVIYDQYIFPGLGMEISGHTLIDSVSFSTPKGFRFDKARPFKLGDSVDLHTEQDWARMRKDTITTKEKNTYRVMDSLFKKVGIEPILAGVGKLVINRLPIGKVDVDITRLLVSNKFERIRTGIGLYTNEKVSRHFSVGGWGGYGWRDKKFKYGFSGTVFLNKNTDNWLRVFYNDDYQNAGNIIIHPEVDRGGYRKWLLITPDRVREYGAIARAQVGYWQVDVNGRQQKLTALYPNNFRYDGKFFTEFTGTEAGVGLRYAYGEKRAPVFGYYFPTAPSKYPVLYLRAAYGTTSSGDYSTTYGRVLAAINFNKQIRRWGRDDIRIEAGLVKSFNDMPLSRSFLLASKGFRRDGLSYYAKGGFLTMRPFDYYTDRYFCIMYKHDFDKFLWKTSFSKPFVSIGHNLMYGTLRPETMAATEGIRAPVSGYHESGFLLNQLLQLNFLNTSYIYVNAGAYYHWTPSFDKENMIWLIGFSAGF